MKEFNRPVVPLPFGARAGLQVEFVPVIRADQLSVAAPAVAQVGPGMRAMDLGGVEGAAVPDEADLFPAGVHPVDEIGPGACMLTTDLNPLHCRMSNRCLNIP